MQFLSNLFSGLIIGGIASLGFAPVSLWIAPFIAFFLLYQILAKSAVKNRIIIAYAFGLALLLLAQSWTGIYVGNLPFIALSLMQAIFFLPFALVAKSPGIANSLTFSCAFVLSELLMRTIPFTGFGWSRLSFTQIESPLAAFYPILGVAGVAFLIGLVSTLRKVRFLAILFVIIAGAQFVPTDLKSSGKLEVALVQGGVPQLGLEFNSTPMAVYENHYQQSKLRIAPDSVDLIIWPENAVDVDIFKNPLIQSQISQLSQDLNTPILIGGISRISGDLQNIAVFFDSDVKQIYAKRYLTPFGEYVPLRTILDRFSPYVQDVKDFTAGTKEVVFDVGSADFQSFICYEIINDSFRDQMLQDFLVLQTNNATFGDTSQLEQQHNIARVRALEMGREIAYVSTTGITSFINKDGNIRTALPKFTGNVLVDEVNLYEGQTYAQKLKFYPEIASILLLLLLLLKRVRS